MVLGGSVGLVKVVKGIGMPVGLPKVGEGGHAGRFTKGR